ncbi:MAG: hypothetical protein DMG39_05110 [Acidobacteria bacterium]|nr:MAG: hypothetical protein DMG39_05110 [Acidobacteriota bacterium]
MDILAALKREEAKLQKQADTVRAAIKILGGRVTSSGKRIGRKKRKMSAATRAKISKATKARWAKFRAEKAKGKH